ncbi:MAG TPA: ATP-binding protein [Dermatophilaceae bacterium]|nr:ATP-binding protein [Dermatophilaceae bacterium]
MERSLSLLHSVLGGLAAGTDPDRLLADAVAGAVAAAAGRSGAVVVVAGGELVTLAGGSPGDLERAAVRAAIETCRTARRRDADGRTGVVAEPLLLGGGGRGALVVTSSIEGTENETIALFASAAVAVLQRRAATTPEALPELLSSLAGIARDLDPSTMAARILDAARDLFGIDASLCALSADGVVRVAHYRGIDPERLAAASRLPGFRTLVTGDDVRVDRTDNPVVAAMGLVGQVAVGLPLRAGGRSLGRVVILLPDVPPVAGRTVLERFASQAAVCLLASQLHKTVLDQQQRVASVAHAVAQPLVLVDEAGRLIEVNGAAATVFGLSGGFDRGRPVVGRLGHPELERMLSAGRDGSAEVVVGVSEPRVYRAMVRPVRAADGRISGRVLVLDDVTAARRTDALKADFVAVIGHELRTPITVMKGFLKTLIRRGDTLSEDRRLQALQAVDASVGRLERLIEDLLFISAIEERSATLDLRPVDLRGLLEPQAGGRVVLRMPDRPVEVDVDADRVAQVVRHLLDNALQHSQGEVRLELAERDGAAEVAVVDAGPGIFSGDLPHLFERFHQIDGSSTRSHGGVGIGLYVCRRIVEAMGGRIWCESRLGVGSRFVFSLPCSSSQTISVS